MSYPPHNSIGVIVARFQVAELHEGHLWLINEVAKRHKYLLIMLGTTIVKGSSRNPLSFEDRRFMLQQSNLFRPEYTLVKMRQAIALEHNTTVFIDKVADHSSDYTWSANLDARIDYYVENHIHKGALVDRFAPYGEACIYGARDSAIPYYKGYYGSHQLTQPQDMNFTGTEARKEIIANPPHTVDYRKGKIAANADRYPINYMCVDAVIYNSEKRSILLGRKPGENKFRFIGGFTDPTDSSLESAAAREAGEEVRVKTYAIDIETTGLNGESLGIPPIEQNRPIEIDMDMTMYVGSVRIDDPRYRSESDKIMSAVIVCETYDYDGISPADDIEEVKWISLDDLVNEDIMDAHRVIVELLKNKWIPQQRPRLTDAQVSAMFYDG